MTHNELTERMNGILGDAGLSNPYNEAECAPLQAELMQLIRDVILVIKPKRMELDQSERHMEVASLEGYDAYNRAIDELEQCEGELLGESE